MFGHLSLIWQFKNLDLGFRPEINLANLEQPFMIKISNSQRLQWREQPELTGKVAPWVAQTREVVMTVTLPSLSTAALFLPSNPQVSVKTFVGILT